MKKYTLFIIPLLFMVSACGNKEEQPAENSDNTETGTPVYIQELQPQTFNHYLNLQGTVESDKTILISPKTSATVKQINVEAGDEVTDGQVLATLDGEITNSQLEEVRTQLELARTLFEKQKNLRDQDIGSEVEFLQAQNRVESLEKQLNTLSEQYKNYTIRATIGGTLNRVMLKEGETVSPAAPVFQIANSEALKVTTEISEAYITRIDRTDSVFISFPSLDTSVSRTLDVVSKVIDASNRTFSVETDIPSLGGTVRPNMIAKVRINDYSASNQIVVPVNTVLQDNQASYVFIAVETDSGWAARQQEVETGMSYGNALLITNGLNAGDLLISEGYNDLRNGDMISIKEN